jgi:hypothetical protein
VFVPNLMVFGLKGLNGLALHPGSIVRSIACRKEADVAMIVSQLKAEDMINTRKACRVAWVVAGLVSVSIAAPIAAQSALNVSKTASGSKPRELLFAGIELTDAQRNRILSIHDSATATLRARRTAVREGRSADTTTLRDSVWTVMRNVLTSEQRVVFDSNLVVVRQRIEKPRPSSIKKEQSTE